MRSEIIEGKLKNIKLDEDGCVVIECNDVKYVVSAVNDCCGYSVFYLPENFNTSLDKCIGGNIMSFIKDSDVELDNSDLKFERDEDGDEQENYLFKLLVEKLDGKNAELCFGLRSYHNGYYPAEISIHTCYTLEGMLHEH